MNTHLIALRQLTSGRVVENEPLAPRTTLGVGGPADILVEVDTEDELASVMKYVSGSRIAWTILGSGANVVVSDEGVRGVVITLGGDFERIDVDGSRLTAGSAARISEVADVAVKHGLCGLEGVGTVPGTVGGAIVMNAGTHRGYVEEVVENVSVMTHSGEKFTLAREECGFTYRSSRFQTDRSMIITSVTFALRPGDGAAAKRHLDEVRAHRAESQPKGRSAGCFFKNPPGQSAGKLIELAGGKGLREDGAVVSGIHANFIINEGSATASDIRELAERVRQLVLDKHGIELQYEVRFIGEW